MIDTALEACTAAVFDGDMALAVRSEMMARGHSERLGGFVRDAVVEAGGGFGAIDRIGVTVGPGSFTGLRVGLAFAQGLGAALGRPVVGISTLAALAWSADAGAGRTAAVIDARRGQVYLQRFQNGRPLSPPEAMVTEEAGVLLGGADGPWRLTGSGAELVGGDAPGERVPSPVALAFLTESAEPAAHPPHPLYLRAPDAIPPTRLPGQARPVPASAG
ncbi:tRNA (adenosine(37)-N6)-threonylcarbamoyltransferase complex dimerization subunit type 1 TsaB [Brevundimonas sp. R86498]|uniref:tRNA (adenosine(37)-N6)-threonylcarbamoyltransferase complex dimerization subunit type 1 TsaB n=1 Tax=Brevundimonas sp. R86498 TaxID=3093845 RepID=UPI0037CC673B